MNNLTQIQDSAYNKVLQSISFNKINKTATVEIQNHVAGLSLENTNLLADFKTVFQGRSSAFQEEFKVFMKEIVANAMGIPIEELSGEFTDEL